MISESKARELDFYFVHDHKARKKTFLITTVLGTCSYLLFKMQDAPDKTAFIASVVLILCAFYVRLALYRSSATRASKRIANSAIELNRRNMLVRISVFAAALIAMVIGNQKLTMAEAINRGITRLRRSGHIKDAQRLARRATESAIPLWLDNVTSLEVHYLPEPQLNSSNWVPVAGNRAFIRIGDGSLLSIRLPIVYIHKGRYRVDSMVTSLGSVSSRGDGPFESFICPTFPDTPETPAVFDYSNADSDSILYGMGGVQEKGYETDTPPAFIKCNEQSLARLVLASVSISGLKQVLDGIIWQDTEFIKCHVICSGRRFQLIRSRFVECRFTFSHNTPNEVKLAMLNQQTDLTLTFNP
jgi:hypothetical protein